MSHQRLYPNGTKLSLLFSFDNLLENINVNSRKIKKVLPLTSSPSVSNSKEAEGPVNRKYFVCEEQTKQAILSELKSKLIQENEANHISFSEFFNKLHEDENSFQKCNDILKDTLFRHVMM